MTPTSIPTDTKTLAGYEHSLRWSAYNGEQLWFPRGGANRPIAQVFRRRGVVAARLRFPWVSLGQPSGGRTILNAGNSGPHC